MRLRILLEGRDFTRGLPILGTVPAHPEFFLVEPSPSQDSRHGPRRQSASIDSKRLNLDERLMGSVGGMKVRRLVITEVHANHDPEETAEHWHRPR
jgi:hypothetical protein